MTLVSEAFGGTLAFAVSAGLATFFAPCAYPLLPGYVGYYLSRDDAALSGAFARGLAATTGALVTLAAIGAVLITAGQRLVSGLGLLEPIIGVALVVFGGLLLAGRAPSLHVMLPERRASVGGFAIFGAIYALAAAGCVVPIFLGVVTQSLALPLGEALLVLGGYAASVALPLAGVTLLAAAGSDAMQGLNQHIGTVQRIAAVVMVVAGFWQIGLSLRYLGVI